VFTSLHFTFPNDVHPSTFTKMLLSQWKQLT
jgi:hypothetical protein